MSATQQTAVDGIAHGYAEAALSRPEGISSFLFWSAQDNFSKSFEADASAFLREGVEFISTAEGQERMGFSIPHKSLLDAYKDCIEDYKSLANESHTNLIVSVIEEPYVHALSIEAAARDALFAITKKSYEENVLRIVKAFVDVVPVSPFAGIIFKQAQELKDVVPETLRLREYIAPYRKHLKEYRDLHKLLIVDDSLYTALQLEKMQMELTKVLQFHFDKLKIDVAMRHSSVFDLLRGIQRVGLMIYENKWTNILDESAREIVSSLRKYRYMNYGGVFEVVSRLKSIRQLEHACEKLVGSPLDRSTLKLLEDAAKLFKSNYGLTRI